VPLRVRSWGYEQNFSSGGDRFVGG